MILKGQVGEENVTHFKALPNMRLNPQRILRLTGEFSQAQLQEWEVDQLMWWSKFQILKLTDYSDQHNILKTYHRNRSHVNF